MKVGIDLSIAQISQAGTAVYATSLTSALRRLDAGLTLSIFQVNQKREMSTKKNSKSRFETLYRDLIWTHWLLPQQVARADVDILHMPANIIPEKSSRPTVVTILDTIIIEHPQHFTPWFRNYARVFVPRAARRADRILTISEQSRKDIIRLFRVPPEKVAVTYLAAEPQFSQVSTKERIRIREKFGLGRFLLTLGTLEPRKNLVRLFQAFAQFRKSHPSIDLVHVGPRGWMFESVLDELTRLNISNCVKFLGHVPLADLPGLYAAAELFVYPSLYEGFGLPVLEAMSCGCPVVSSNTSSIPEVTGNAAKLVDPLDVSAIAAAMQIVVEDIATKERLQELGLMRCKLFSWERCALETVKVYNEVLQA